MQYPFDVKYHKILYYSEPLSARYEGSGIDRMKIKCEPEIVLYNDPSKPICLAIQGHPEYMRKESPVIEMLNNLVNKILTNEINK